MAQEGYDVHLVAIDKNLTSYKSGNVTIHPLSVPRSRLERIFRRWKVADTAARVSADLYHVHEPELLGPILDRVGRAPVIYDVHESYLDVLGQREWIPQAVRPLAKAIWRRLEARLVRKCRAIVTVVEPIAERYSNLHHRVEIVRNFPDFTCEEFNCVSQPDRTQACVFAGTLSKDRNLKNMVLAIGLLRKRGVDLQLWLAGKWESTEYEQAIQKLVIEEGVTDRVRYSGILSHQDALSLESRASIGMATLLPIKNSLNSLPIKVFECMALGLPVVYSNFPLLQTYIGKCGVGLAVDPESPEQIADALESLVKDPEMASNMGQSAKRAVIEKFNWANEGKRLNALYREILEPRFANVSSTS